MTNINKESVGFVRAILKDDALLIHKWRNDPRTTKYWVNKRIIPIEEHMKWFEKKLNDPREMLLFSVINSQKIGVIRITTGDYQGIKYGEIGIYINPDLHSKGFGLNTLLSIQSWIIEKNLMINLLVARVGKSNVASNKIFTKAGFTLTNIEISESNNIENFISGIIQETFQNKKNTELIMMKPDIDLTHFIYAKKTGDLSKNSRYKFS